MFFGVTMLVLLSAVFFFGARGFVLAQKSNKKEFCNDRVFLVKTFWTVSIAMVLLFAVGLIRLVMNYLGLIPGGLSYFSVSWWWVFFASSYAWEAYALNERIKKLPRK